MSAVKVMICLDFINATALLIFLPAQRVPLNGMRGAGQADDNRD